MIQSSDRNHWTSGANRGGGATPPLFMGRSREREGSNRTERLELIRHKYDGVVCPNFTVTVSVTFEIVSAFEW